MYNVIIKALNNKTNYEVHWFEAKLLLHRIAYCTVLTYQAALQMVSCNIKCNVIAGWFFSVVIHMYNQYVPPNILCTGLWLIFVSFGSFNGWI